MDSIIEVLIQIVKIPMRRWEHLTKASKTGLLVSSIILIVISVYLIVD